MSHVRSRFVGRALLWSLVYTAVAGGVAAAAMLLSARPGRALAIELGVALGFVGFAMLALQFALTAKFRRVSRLFGLDNLLHFHREAGIIALVLILAHILVLIAARPVYLSFLDPRDELPRAAALITVLLALLAIVGSTLWRRLLRLPYDWWRVLHAGLATLVVFIGMVHMLRVGWYISTIWARALVITLGLAAIGLLAYARVWKPIRMRAESWRVKEVKSEGHRVWTLVLRPDGHEGMRFEPGQFVWLVVGDSPFTLQQHPFSIASSAARPEELELTIKELGDYTAGIGAVAPGTRAYMDGPYGSFTLPADGGAAVCIAGGIGITPAMSLARTLADRGDQRPLTLIHGARARDTLIFAGELKQLAQRSGVRSIQVLEDPPPDWEGETGMIDQRLLERLVPHDDPATHYFICGPEPMMDACERHLRGLGVSMDRFHSERFQIA